MPKPRRNESCPCGSGLKYKDCHGNTLKLQVCKHAANEMMLQLIFREKLKKGMICKHGVPTSEHCKACKIGD